MTKKAADGLETSDAGFPTAPVHSANHPPKQKMKDGVVGKDDTKEYTINVDGTIIDGKSYKAGDKVKLAENDARVAMDRGLSLTLCETEEK